MDDNAPEPAGSPDDDPFHIPAHLLRRPEPAWYVQRIRARWQDGADAILSVGALLIQAKCALPHGQFEAMVNGQLPFEASASRKLMAIARHDWLANREHVHVLPPSWGTLYELSHLTGEQLDAAVQDGAVRADMDRGAARALRRADRRRARLARAEALSRKSTPLAEIAAGGRTWPVIYMDPPWLHETWSEKGQEKSPENHYPTMTVEALKALPVGALAARDAALLVWVPGKHLGIGIALMAHYGFDYKANAVWHKTNADGSPHRGTGYWFIDTHELLLLGTRGDIPAPLPGTQAESCIPAPVGEHSAKPAIFRELIERYFPDVGRLELFLRGPVPAGWEAWGNEVEEG